MQYVSFLDFILYPFYLLIFYFCLRVHAKKHITPNLKSFFYNAFFLRMFGCFAYTLVIQYYYGYGDTLSYYKGGNIFFEQILKDFSNIKYIFSPVKEVAEWYDVNYDDTNFGSYFAQPTGNPVMKISGVLSFFSFNKILIISLFLALFSFAGQWKLFLVFNEVNQNRNSKILAFAALYTPSIWFWGSGLLKDSICIGALGFSVSFLYKIFIKKKFSISSLLLLFIMLALLIQIKIYIFAVLMLAIGLFIVKNIMIKIRTLLVRFILLVFALLCIWGVVVSIDLDQQVNNLVEESFITRNVLKTDYEQASEGEGSKGGFTAAELNPTLSSIVANSPATIFSCLYRPFLWESRSIMILFTSLESTMLLIFTLYLIFKTNFFGFFRLISKSPYLVFSFWLSIAFALIIGFTTFNFGTMIRYKIIFLPFFYFLHIYIYSEIKQKNKLASIPKKILAPALR